MKEDTIFYDVFPSADSLGELESAVIISLFSWRRAKEDDNIEPNQPREGWWGDKAESEENISYPIGSRLWLLRREKITPAIIQNAVDYAKEALQWLVDDGIVSSVDISTELSESHKLSLLVMLYRNGAEEAGLRFYDLWNEIGEGNG